MAPSSPQVGLGVFVLNDRDEFLVGFRESEHGHGTWSLPGGHLEHGESFAEASRREVMEETGVLVGSLRVATVTNDLFPESNRHYVTIWMVGDHVEGEPTAREPDKFTNLRWVSANALPEPVFSPFAGLMESGELSVLLCRDDRSGTDLPDQAALAQHV